MGANYAPQLAELFLYSNEKIFSNNFTKNII